MKLKNSRKGEVIKQIIRKSLIAYFLATTSNLILVLLWWTAIYLSWCWIIYWNFKIYVVEFIILIFYWIAVLWIWLYFWYHTYLLITNHRIEKKQPTYFFWKKKEILWYNEISKISYSYPNIISHLLNYWNIEIIAWDTHKNNIIFTDAPHPEKIVITLRKLKKEYEAKLK